MNFIRNKLIIMHDSLQNIRRELHKIPESGFNEVKTQAYIINFLNKNNVEYSITAKTGVIAIIKGKDQTNATAFRTDIDGLGMIEENTHDFVSTHKGMMHACGHDGHMTIALGLIQYIVENKIELNNNLIVIFQPAEEGPGGAEVIVNEGIIEKYNIKDIFAYHLFPEVYENCFSSRVGPIMAQTGEFDIDIYTKGSHGAMPHLGVDAAVVGSELLLKIQTIVARNINPIDPVVVTVGHMKIGQRRNVIADHARLEGTMRAFNEEIYKKIKEFLYKYAMNCADEDVKVEVEFRDMYLSVDNNQILLDDFVKAVGKDRYKESNMYMIAEDFSFYQKSIPGVFVFLGIRNDEKKITAPLHSSTFNFDEKVLLNAIEGYLRYLVVRGVIDEQ